MSRRAARNKSRHLMHKATRNTMRGATVPGEQLSPSTGQSAIARSKTAGQARSSFSTGREHNVRRYTGKAYRRFARQRRAWVNTLLGVVAVCLLAFFGYLWYTINLSTTGTPTSSGGSNITDSSDRNTNDPKAIPTYQQKNGIIWANQQLTSELGNQVAQTLRLSTDQIENALQTMTMVELAEKQGLTDDQWHTTMLNFLKNDLASLVRSGQFTQDTADTNNTFYAQHPDHLDDTLASLFSGHVLEHTPTTQYSANS
jgi:hypothetical protein